MSHDIVSVTFDRSDGHANYGFYTGGDRIWRDTGQKLYDYRAPAGLLQEDDQAVVDSPYGTAVVTVRRVNGIEQYKGATKWVVCKVDRSVAERREELVASVDGLQKHITEVVDELWALRRVEIMAREYPILAECVARLGQLETELASIGGR